MENTSSKAAVEAYIFHGLEEVVIGIFRGDKMLGYYFVPKRELGERLVEGFSTIMKSCGLELGGLDGIYLNNSFSTWNASRLVTILVKTIFNYVPINCYLREASQDQLDALEALKSFPKHRKSFKKVNLIDEITPLYKKCPNINI